MKPMNAWFSVAGVLTAMCLLSCGRHKSSDPGGGGGVAPSSGGGGGGGGGGASATPAPATAPDAPGVVRGRWTMPMGGGESGAPLTTQLLAAGPNQAITATVAANTQFTVANTKFKTPNPTGVASYGSLDITALSDNNLSVCGAGGTTQCTTAVIRSYTTGTPGAGLWNTAGGYGLPITTATHTIGLNAAGAYTIGSVTLGTAHAVSLSMFTTAATLSIPISVDFSGAGVGSYASTLVVEFILQ